ncbi:FAD:protein FMN transferase [Eikenella sp. S3360]|uniref:FAD:protein FMN transferase n=1 Tax=Eikenella glucosivorans TaxID=2766967 RepID=A0ABS0NBM9_9NEIS|nr:FAD:protein FMN transferase [Eikenella glucosivorans]MBH5329715.1 FAD:protein FMN transferase [Eikenella glucosivorans]
MNVATFIAMGTVNTITLFEPDTQNILPRVFEYVKSMEQKLTVHHSDSEIMRLNANAGIAPVAVSEEVFALLLRAHAASLEEGSGFNFALGALTRLWRAYQKQGIVPFDTQIAAARALCDPHLVWLDAGSCRAFLTQPGMSLDLGAIAKGYIADGVKRLLAEAGIERATIDLGGNVVLHGQSPKQADGLWRVGIQQPYAAKGEYAAVCRLPAVSVVTSGVYERYAEAGGRQYHHLINPQTGYPFDNGMLGATVIAPDSTEAEIRSTQIFAQGAAGAADSRSDVWRVLIDKEKRMFVSRALLPFFELKDAAYQVIPV